MYFVLQTSHCGSCRYIKLTDFGLSKSGVGRKERTGSFCGSTSYMAPEVILDMPFVDAVAAI